MIILAKKYFIVCYQNFQPFLIYITKCQSAIQKLLELFGTFDLTNGLMIIPTHQNISRRCLRGD